MYVSMSKIQQLPKVARGNNNKPYTSLDTLAQLPTETKKVLYKRGRSKYYTNQVIVPLLYLDSPLHKQYQRAYYCNNTIIQEGNKYTSKYCNSRVCHICNRIRTAKCMNNYIEQLKTIGNLSFTTLTIPNVTNIELMGTVREMKKKCTNILRVLREKRKIPISGVRKIEITYNDKTDTYHPHIHLLHSEECGQMIIEMWLKNYSNASIKGQDTRQADQNSINEIFKYSTKIAYKQKSDKTHKIFVSALDTIFQSLHKLRTFQTFGTLKQVSEEVEELQSQIIEEKTIEQTEQKEWAYNYEIHDWQNIDTGELLTMYKPPQLNIEIYY
jgi:Replication protein